MKMRFVGKTSCGFISNRIYDVEIRSGLVRTNGKIKECVIITDKNGGGRCPYESLNGINANWKLV